MTDKQYKTWREQIKSMCVWIKDLTIIDVVSLFGAVVLGFYLGTLLHPFINGKISISLTEFLGGILAVIGILLLSKRTFNQDKQLEYQQKQIQFQVVKEVDDRFTSAITLLGSNQTSARTGALYVLYDLAVKNDKYRKQVAEIMCGHIRGHTQTQTYRQENKTKPADDIQTAINLLFRGSETQDQKGLYCHSFAASLHRPNLSHSFLRGADFKWAICICADFRYADCIGAFFMDGKFQGAIFVFTACQGAFFTDSKCEGANFIGAQCQGVDFSDAQCQGANFGRAHCQGALFKDTQCHGTISNKKLLMLDLSDRVGKPTELNNIVFSGDLAENFLTELEPLAELLGGFWFEKMKNIYEEHRNKPADYTLPKGIITGELEDTEEIRQIIAEIKKYD